MTPEEKTVKDIAERMVELYNRSVKLDSQAATTMGDFSFDVPAPVIVSVFLTLYPFSQ